MVRFIAVPITQVIVSTSAAINLSIYIVVRGLHKPTWVPFSVSNYRGVVTWVRLAIPGMLMVCAEWWGFEINIMVAGLLGSEELAAMALIYNVMTFFYTFPMSFSICAAVLVGNAVGAADIPRAKRQGGMVIVLAVAVQCLIVAFMLFGRSYWPRLFTEDPEVLSIVIRIVPLLCWFTVVDCVQTSVGGMLRGCGKQSIGAITYICAYYGVGMGIGIPLALATPLGVIGQWIGISTASTTCMIVLSIYFIFLSWDKVVREAFQRLEIDHSHLETSESGESPLSVELEELNEAADAENTIS